MTIYTCTQGHELTDPSPSTGRRYCRICASARKKKYYIENKEKVRDLNKKYYTENKEAIRENQKRYRTNHLDTAREYGIQYRDRVDNQKKARDYNKKYYTKNPEVYSAARARRRALEQNQMGEWNISQRAFIRSLIENIHDCYYCHTPLNGKHHVEHMIPLSRGGLHAPDNLTLSCPSCNLSKGTMTAEEFIARSLRRE